MGVRSQRVVRVSGDLLVEFYGLNVIAERIKSLAQFIKRVNSAAGGLAIALETLYRQVRLIEVIEIKVPQ